MTTAPAVPALPGTGRLADELRAVQVVWHRDMLHYVRDRVKIGVTLLQPLMLLLVLGVGLSSLLPSSNGADYRTFLFPGMLIMMVQSPAISAGVSLVTDRQFGFLREMVVAPVRRETLLVGKCLAGATMATCQGLLLLPLAGVAGIPYDPVMMAALLGEMAVIALMLTALGTMLAVLIRRVETFHALLGVLATPLLFLSGAMFPPSGLPGWLSWGVTLNPVSYAVDALRRTITASFSGPVTPRLFNGPTWGGWTPPVALELALITVAGLIMLVIGGRRFGRSD